MNLAVVEADQELSFDGLRIVGVLSQVCKAYLVDLPRHQLVVPARSLQLLIPEVNLHDHSLPVKAVEPRLQVDLVDEEGADGVVHFGAMTLLLELVLAQFGYLLAHIIEHEMVLASLFLVVQINENFIVWQKLRRHNQRSRAYLHADRPLVDANNFVDVEILKKLLPILIKHFNVKFAIVLEHNCKYGRIVILRDVVDIEEYFIFDRYGPLKRLPGPRIQRHNRSLLRLVFKLHLHLVRLLLRHILVENVRANEGLGVIVHLDREDVTVVEGEAGMLQIPHDKLLGVIAVLNVPYLRNLHKFLKGLRVLVLIQVQVLLHARCQLKAILRIRTVITLLLLGIGRRIRSTLLIHKLASRWRALAPPNIGLDVIAIFAE